MATTPSIPSGAVTLFRQVAAPVGWTKNTALNDYALRVVGPTGGSFGGTSASGGNASITFTTLNTINVPVSGTFNITSATVSPAVSSLPAHYHSTTYPYATAPQIAADSHNVTNTNTGRYISGAHSAPSSGGDNRFSPTSPLPTGLARGPALGEIFGNDNTPSGATGTAGATHGHTSASPFQTLPISSVNGGGWGFNLSYLDVILCTRN